MLSLVVRRKTVGFESPTLTSRDTDSESDEDESSAILKRAMQLTTKHRFKQLIGDALQLERRNTLAVRDHMEGEQHVRQRRLQKIRGAGRKPIHIPRMAQLVKTSSDKPIVKFRRVARAVLLLIQVCNVCKDVVASGVRREPWFALLDNLVAKTTLQSKRKGPRAFVTFVPNEQRQLVQLSFDVSNFKRDHRTEFILTDEVRDMMTVMPGYRTPYQVAEIIRVLKALFTFFANYKLQTQKEIGQCAFFDRYKANRVIVKKGHHPDGIYFILSGSVVEKHEGQPKLINAGEKFGESDLLCGVKRRHTVLTKVDTEIFYLHRQDYRVIFDLSEDRHNPKNLDICKQHIVFQHFPLHRLAENPGTWTVNSYKYGQLIAQDGNNLDWIYVIKSGEARVLKYLKPDQVDIRARRRKVQTLVKSQSPFYKKTRLLDFVQHRDYIQSAYRPSTYRPPVGKGRLSARSAPPSTTKRLKAPLVSRSCVSLPNTRQGPRLQSGRKLSTLTQLAPELTRSDSALTHPDKDDLTLPRLVVNDPLPEDQHNPEAKDGCEDPAYQADVEETEEKAFDDVTKLCQEQPAPGVVENGDDVSHEGQVGGTQDGQEQQGDVTEGRVSHHVTLGPTDKAVLAGEAGDSVTKLPDPGAARPSILVRPDTRKADRVRGRSASFLKTPCPGNPRQASGGSEGQKTQVIQVGKHTLPAFVQVDLLHPGQVFGLRACLDPEERGPSVSLVSGECEVLQINKKFFMKHCDDAIFSLIRLKNKPFPSEEDLMDRLDVNLQWEEFKQSTMSTYLTRSRSSRR